MCGTGVNGWPDDELLARLDEVQLQGKDPPHRHLFALPASTQDMCAMHCS